MATLSRLSLAQPAVRRGRKARIALDGPSGGGKTWTALAVGARLAGEDTMLVIDTEHGSASLYDDIPFTHIIWEPPFDPRELAQTLDEAGGKYGVVIVDSLSHFWEAEGGTRDIVDAAASRSGGNSFAGWKTGTPAQNDMTRAILRCNAHVICTMRSKMEYVLESGNGGKQVPRKVGLAPIQRPGMEYEFTVIGDIDLDHRLTITKSRYSAVADKVYQPHHAHELGEALSAWLGSAAAELEPAERVFAEKDLCPFCEMEGLTTKSGGPSRYITRAGALICIGVKDGKPAGHPAPGAEPPVEEPEQPDPAVVVSLDRGHSVVAVTPAHAPVTTPIPIDPVPVTL